MTEQTTRTERDSLGEVEVPIDALFGAQTQRAVNNFAFSAVEVMPYQIIDGYLLLKKCAAKTNVKLGKLDPAIGAAIVDAADQLIDQRLTSTPPSSPGCEATSHDPLTPLQSESAFPLTLWQSGSGTQTNMNVNEVLANLASRTSGLEVLPNDHVNMGQSSNDTFATVSQIAICQQVFDLTDQVAQLADAFKAKSAEFNGEVKLGRTHTQDALPMFVSDELDAWSFALCDWLNDFKEVPLVRLTQLPLGATAIGTGLNADPAFVAGVLQELNDEIALPVYEFTQAENLPYALAFKAPLRKLMFDLKGLATTLYKISNDIRFYSSGPRAGFAEFILPENEPGSSIMPGKVNPTQVESLAMVCAQVIGNEAGVTFAASQGHFQLNTFAPMIAANAHRSIELLSAALENFRQNLVNGLDLNRPRLKQNVESSAMLVTALAPTIGYKKAAAIAQHALAQNLTILQAATNLTDLDPATLTNLLDPALMAKGNRT